MMNCYLSGWMLSGDDVFLILTPCWWIVLAFCWLVLPVFFSPMTLGRATLDFLGY